MRITINLDVNSDMFRSRARVAAAIAVLAVVGIGAFAISRSRSATDETAAGAAATGGGMGPSAPTAVIPLGQPGSEMAPTKTRETPLIQDPACASERWEIVFPPETVDSRTYACTVPGFPKLRRVTIRKSAKNLWDIQLRQDVSHAIVVGSHLRLSIWARSADSLTVRAACEHNAEPYEKLGMSDFVLTPKWQRYDLAWTADHNEPAGWAHVTLDLGTKTGNIDLAGAELTASTAVS
jgi:hypothetical protein